MDRTETLQNLTFAEVYLARAGIKAQREYGDEVYDEIFRLFWEMDRLFEELERK